MPTLQEEIRQALADWARVVQDVTDREEEVLADAYHPLWEASRLVNERLTALGDACVTPEQRLAPYESPVWLQDGIGVA